jgi:hypothetical protein
MAILRRVRPGSSHASVAIGKQRQIGAPRRVTGPRRGICRRCLLENHEWQFAPRQAARRSRSGRGWGQRLGAAARVLAIGHCYADEFVGAWGCPSRSRFLSGRRRQRRLLYLKPSERAILRRPKFSEWRCSCESVHQGYPNCFGRSSVGWTGPHASPKSRARLINPGYLRSHDCLHLGGTTHFDRSSFMVTIDCNNRLQQRVAIRRIARRWSLRAWRYAVICASRCTRRPRAWPIPLDHCSLGSS